MAAIDGRTCAIGTPQSIIYDDRFRIELTLPNQMDLLLLKKHPTVLDVATRKGSGSKQNTLIVMMGADLDNSLHRYSVDIVLEYSTDIARPNPPTPERIVEHGRTQTGAEIPWAIDAFGGTSWAHSDRRTLDFSLRPIDGGGFASRHSSEEFIRPIDADVDIRVEAEYRLMRDERPEGWLEARSECTHSIVSSIKISQIAPKE
jgi:hypothetical protein